MIVQQSKWSEQKERYVRGKRHWAVTPRRTKCGKQIEEDWLVHIDVARMRGVFEHGCKACFR